MVYTMDEVKIAVAIAVAVLILYFIYYTCSQNQVQMYIIVGNDAVSERFQGWKDTLKKKYSVEMLHVSDVKNVFGDVTMKIKQLPTLLVKDGEFFVQYHPRSDASIEELTAAFENFDPGLIPMEDMNSDVEYFAGRGGGRGGGGGGRGGGGGGRGGGGGGRGGGGGGGGGRGMGGGGRGGGGRGGGAMAPWSGGGGGGGRPYRGGWRHGGPRGYGGGWAGYGGWGGWRPRGRPGPWAAGARPYAPGYFYRNPYLPWVPYSTGVWGGYYYPDIYYWDDIIYDYPLDCVPCENMGYKGCINEYNDCVILYPPELY